MFRLKKLGHNHSSRLWLRSSNQSESSLDYLRGLMTKIVHHMTTKCLWITIKGKVGVEGIGRIESQRQKSPRLILEFSLAN